MATIGARLTIEFVRQCFVDAQATNEKIPVPSLTACNLISDEINSRLDREYNKANGVFDKIDSTHILRGRNVSLAEIKSVLFNNVMTAGSLLYEAIESYNEYDNAKESNPFPFAELARLLENMGTTHSRPTEPKRRGAPRETRNLIGAAAARLVSTALRDSGYSGAIDKCNADSATAIICSAIISRAYGVEISADKFANAMKKIGRDRGKQLSFEERFPDAARIRVR